MSKENVLKAITGLVASLQKSLHKVRQKTTENTEDIDLLGDSVAELFDGQTALLTRTEESGKISVERDCQLSDKIEATRAQSFQRTEALALQIAKVKEENDKRETQQAFRDQNNVQSLVNLKDSTQKAFDQVKTDVKNLMAIDERTNLRLSGLEYFRNDLVERAKKVVTLNFNPTPAAPLPSDHVWVNKKLTGVYDTTTDLENRVKKLEEENTKLKSLPLAVRTFGVDTFMGHDVKFVNDKLYVGQGVFPFVEDITNVIHQRGQLLVVCRSGDIYVLTGGPNVNTMFVYQHSRA